MISGKTIFICPLDWGLGHATRCVPIIGQLHKNNTVLIGVTPLTQAIFDKAFPHLQKVEMPSYNIRYSATFPIWLKLLLDWPRTWRVIRQEQKLLRHIANRYNIDVVISDNRFGLHDSNCYNIFITHQLFLKTPFANLLAQRINKKYILKFNEVWVPDHADPSQSLAGELSHGKHFHPHVNYIGPQSYLSGNEALISNKEEIDYLLLLSGAEPQRSMLEQALLKEFEGSVKKVVLVRGTKQNALPGIKGIKVIDLAIGEELRQLIVTAKTVICRSGYSTLMDLHALGKKDMVLIPTPGQTEQEYLAEYWKEKFGCSVLGQNQINRLIG